MAAPQIVFVNNSRETFTPTISGAISTSLWQLAQASLGTMVTPTIITNDAEAEPYPWPQTHFIRRAVENSGARSKVDRAVRRATGWAHTTQHQYARAALRLLKQAPPDVVLCVNDPEIAVYLSQHLPSTRVVHWYVNLELAADAWRRRYTANRKIISLACSRYLARAVEMTYRLRPGSVGCLYPGVDASAFAADRSPRSGPVVIGFLGRVCVEKAPDVLLRACLRLAQTRHDFAVSLLGDTNWGYSVANPYRLEIDDLVDQLVASGIQVNRPGHLSREQVPEALAGCDICVIPSRWDEPFGLVLVEGMAAALPVVGAAVGGIPEIIGGVGELVPREDDAALAKVLAKLLDDPERRQAMAVASQQRAQDFSWTATWQGLLDSAGLTSATE